MPVASPDQYLEMLDRAKKQGFAYPAINVSSSQTLNAALAGLAEAGSDGIIQVTTGGGDYWSGPTIKKMASGAAAMAAFAREAAKNYGVTIALHTDHCAKHQLDDFVRPLIAISQDRVKAGQDPLFNSHMWDGSAVPMGENLTIAKEMLALTKNIGAVLEIEVGVVGGEEDGVDQLQRRPLVGAQPGDGGVQGVRQIRHHRPHQGRLQPLGRTEMVDQIGVGHAQVVGDGLQGHRVRPARQKARASAGQNLQAGFFRGATTATNALY